MAQQTLNRTEQQIKLKRGLEANISATATKNLAVEGEPAYTTDSKIVWIFDGTNFVPIPETWRADQTTDTTPTDDTSAKKLTLQKLAAPPTNAAYVAFSNNPGTDTFYLVLEDA